ncbi:MAG: hypothetical protein CENE_01360 [Candidatus Celerinatantimonas neptuna]|nr:MAG: hypothetical protein CENE_01360 [Candidatus Celerinatantimonas neptuna]
MQNSELSNNGTDQPMSENERLATLQSPQQERINKRLKTLEEDKMRLWKTQNEQQNKINALNTDTRELADKQSTQEEISIDKDIVSQKEINQLQSQLKSLKRQLILTTLLAILLAIWQIDWNALSTVVLALCSN